MNRIFLVGCLGKDPIYMKNEGKKAFCRFTLATSEWGGTESKTTWHNVVCFGKFAEMANLNCKKGDRVFVQGKVTDNSYTNKSGQRVTSQQVVCENLICSVQERKDEAKQEESQGNPDDAINALPSTPDMPFEIDEVNF